MAIIEFRGGPLTHRSLMNKSKADLSRLALEMNEVRIRQVKILLDALKPFAFARMDADDGEKVADWHQQHDSDGVLLIWDPECERNPTLTMGQFKRARDVHIAQSNTLGEEL